MLDYTPSPSLARQLCQPETLHAAWRKVRANKGGPGSDGVTIQQFEANLTKHLRQLSRELTEERYYPLPVQKFTMKKENGGTRELSVLTLKDRIVQRAVCDLISPIYEAKFLDCSFGYRPGRGVPQKSLNVPRIWNRFSDMKVRVPPHIIGRFGNFWDTIGALPRANFDHPQIQLMRCSHLDTHSCIIMFTPSSVLSG